VIPTAKVIEYKGASLVAIPYKPSEVRVLQNLGYDVPPPVDVMYDWPGKFKPFHAQRETVKFLTMQDRAYVLSSMGSGKSMSALWTADFLMRTREIKKCLIIAPLSTLERTWGDSIFYNLPARNFVVLHGSRERRLKLLNEDVDFYIINTDGVKIIVEALEDRPDIDLVVIDELATSRNASTDRWKAINKICNKHEKCYRRVIGMTGTPTPNLPTDAWAQCRLVTPSTVPPYFGRFRDQVMRQVTQWKWVPREGALETVRHAMQPNIRFSLEDCVDLPPQVFETREVEMGADQKKAYRDMLAKLHTEIQEGQITAANEAVKMMKLLQIACGIAYGNNGELHALPNAHRMNVVQEICEEAEGKVIVFVPFTGALEIVAEHLGQTWEIATVHGGTSKRERDTIFKDFQDGGEAGPRIIVANPATMAHGITLTAATVICWYAPHTSNEIYEQACARVRRPGQKRTTVIAHIAGSDVERRMYERLKNKQSMQNCLLQLIREG
jgi:SNF2 family DNA or RNA helicase